MEGFINDRVTWKGIITTLLKKTIKDVQRKLLRSFAQLSVKTYSSAEKLYQTRDESVWSKTQHQKDGSLRIQLSLLARSFAQFSKKTILAPRRQERGETGVIEG